MSTSGKILIKKYVEQMAAGNSNAANVIKFALVKQYGIETFSRELKEVS